MNGLKLAMARIRRIYMNIAIKKEWGSPWALTFYAVLLSLGFLASPTTSNFDRVPVDTQFTDRAVNVYLPGLRPEQFETVRLRLLAVPGVRSVEFADDQELRVHFDKSRTNLKVMGRELEIAGFAPHFH